MMNKIDLYVEYIIICLSLVFLLYWIEQLKGKTESSHALYCLAQGFIH